MIKLGKWIGVGLGWTIGGPIGAVLGFAFGSFVDSSDLDQFGKPEKTTTADFIVSLLVLVAAVMKADQRVLKSELLFVRNYLVRSFGEEETGEMLRILRDLLKQDIPLKDVSHQIKTRMDYASRIQLMHFMYGIAYADGSITERELLQIEKIGFEIGISQPDLESLKSMFKKSNEWAYAILEVSPNDTNEQIKKKYRQMALKNHPDKVAYLGEEIHKNAQEKFQKIQEAWETIKKERKIV